MKKFLLFVLTFILILQLCLVAGCTAVNDKAQSVGVVQSSADGSFFDDVGNLFVGGKPSKIDEEVYLGGYPLGITLDGDGVTVIGMN